jgi:hypothetical protein
MSAIWQCRAAISSLLFCGSLTQGIHEALALPALNPDFLYAALDATAYAAFVKESRKKRAGATKLHRKSGEARD